MPMNAPKYTDDQREAMASAIVDRGIRPAERVSALARAGELTLNGEKLDAFDPPASTVRSCARKLRQRRAGTLKRDIEKENPRDALEQLRLRLVRVADQELAVQERKRRGHRDPEKIRQIARAAREIAAIPERPLPPPGKVDPDTGRKPSGPTTGGLGGAILAAAAKTEPARVETQGTGPEQTPTPPETNTESGEAQRSSAPHDSTDQGEGDGPGAWARAQSVGLLGSRAGSEG